VIFVAVGGQRAPFDRLLLSLEALPRDEELVVQCGTSQVRPTGARSVDFMPSTEFEACVRDARVFVSHGGVGSIMTAFAAGKRPVVVPRLRRLGEHPDDHQHAFTKRLEAADLVKVVEDVALLPRAIRELEPALSPSLEPGPSRRLVADLRELLTSLAAARASTGARR
jgi:beta-1,4-N-acetylglucosaminyltransferase